VIGHKKSRINDDTKVACWGSWCNDGVRWHEKTWVQYFGKLSKKPNEEKLGFWLIKWQEIGRNSLKDKINCATVCRREIVVQNCRSHKRNEKLIATSIQIQFISIQLMFFKVALVNVTARSIERVHIIKRLDEEMIVGINTFLVVGGRSTATVLM